MSGSSSHLAFACRHRFDGGFELDVEFEARSRVTSLFGPSGSGKTTVLSILAGILRPAHGRVEVGGEVLLDTTRGVCLPPERRRIGKVFQDHLLFPHLSVDGNLRYGMKRAGRQAPAIGFDRVVEVLELGGLLQRRPATLSGGQRQRVALGRALLSGPRLLVLDEPLGALDEALKLRVLDYLERVVEEFGIPTLFVSHGPAEVRRLADWVLVLDEGRIVAQGTPEEALADARVLSWGGGIGPVNLILVEGLRLDQGRWSGRVGGQTLVLPEMPDWARENGNAAAGAVYVRVSPADVVLSLEEPSRISVRNRLHGRVHHLVEGRGWVFVALELGPPGGAGAGPRLWAELTREAAAELDLQPGGEVVGLIKTASLEVVGVPQSGLG